MAEVGVVDENLSLVTLFKAIKYDLAQNFVSSDPVPSLKYITLARIAIELWQEDMCEEVGDFFTRTHNPNRILLHQLECMDEFEKQVQDKVSDLILPYDCKEDLERMIHSVGEEISNFFSAQERLYFQSYKKVKIYWDNLRWTQQGKINNLKTAIQVIDHTDLEELDKYILACNICLEERILGLVQNLCEDFLDELYECEHDDDDDGVDIEEEYRVFRLTIYWTLYNRGEHERFSSLIKGEATNKYLMRWALVLRKDAAVQYIWENLADEGMKERLVEYAQFVTGRGGHSNILLYLFKQMSQIQHDEVCVKMGHDLLQTLLRCSRWHNIFIPVAKYAIQFVGEMDVWGAINTAILCWQEKVLALEQYQNIFNIIRINFASDITEHFSLICDEHLLGPMLTVKSDVQTMMLLLRLGSVQQRKEFFSNDYRVELMCAELLSSGKLELLEIFLNEVFTEGEEIVEFKKDLLEQNSANICAELIVKNKYNMLDKVLISCCAKEGFKKELPHKRGAHVLHCIMERATLKDDSELIALEKFFNWSFDGCEDEIVRCKAVIFNLDGNSFFDCEFDNEPKVQFFEHVTILMQRQEWGLVGKYWKWIFFTDKKKIRTRKYKLGRIKRILDLTPRISTSRLFKRFITSCFEGDEIDEIKEEFKGSIVFLVIAADLIKSGDYTIVDGLLDWCYSSDRAQIQEFKISIMMSKGCALLYNVVKYKYNIEWAKCRFRWFNPSVESMKMFAEKFPDFLTDKRNVQLRELKRDGRKVTRANKKAWTKKTETVYRNLNILTDFIKELNLSDKVKPLNV